LISLYIAAIKNKNKNKIMQNCPPRAFLCLEQSNFPQEPTAPEERKKPTLTLPRVISGFLIINQDGSFNLYVFTNQ